MVQCPTCHSQIDEDFGLVTCPSCGAQVLIEIEGDVATAPPALPAEIQPAMEVELSSNMPPLPADLPPLPPEAPVLADDLSQVLVSEVTGEMTKPPIEMPKHSLGADNSHMARSQPAAQVSRDLNQLSNFGNSSASQSREGFLRYNLYISGIDTADVRDQIKEALTDSRFLWDPAHIMQEMQGGEICLKEVTAVKSSILVQRLRALPVEIRWEQYAIQQG